MLQSIQNDLLETVTERVQVVIISANGPVFSSGHDLKELVSNNQCSWGQGHVISPENLCSWHVDHILWSVGK